MAYTPREIKDRVAVGDDIFQVEDLGNNRIRLIPAPTHVSEPGTPVNKALLQPIEDELGNLSATKVDKVPGKGLSTNDFTNALKNKLDGIEAGAQKNTVSSVNGKTGAVNLTKTDVGLGYVQNYGIASKAQAEVGTANDAYMTPLRVKEAIFAVIDVVATGTITLDYENSYLERVEIPGLGSYPRKLTCFYYADDTELYGDIPVHYAFERVYAEEEEEWKMFVSFRSVHESTLTLHYTIVAWND